MPFSRAPIPDIDDFYNAYLGDTMPKSKQDTETQKYIKSCEDLTKELEDFRDTFRTKVEAFFKEKAGFIFTKFPFVNNFSWRQYMPTFCDGDPCSFHSGHEYPDINGEWDEEYEFSPEEIEASPTLAEYVAGGKRQEAVQELAEEAVQAFLSAFDEDDVRTMFGDDVKVTVTKDGIETEDYEPEY